MKGLVVRNNLFFYLKPIGDFIPIDFIPKL